MLMKMIFQHNPHLGKGDEGMVWQRMQQALRVHEAQIAGQWIALEKKSELGTVENASIIDTFLTFDFQRRLCKSSSSSNT